MNYMPACLCGVMWLLQVQKQWLTVPDLVTAVRCLPKAMADSSRFGDNSKILSKAMVDSSRLGDNSKVFVKSNS